MFGWLRRDRRDVFAFHDGRRVRRVDPVPVAVALDDLSEGELRAMTRAALSRAEGTFRLSGTLLESHRKNRGAAQRDVARFARAAFGVTEFDGAGGLTVGECVALAVRFLAFCDQLAAEARPLAEAAAAGVPFPPGRPSYRQWAGVWMSRKGIAAARAEALAEAVAEAVRG